MTEDQEFGRRAADHAKAQEHDEFMRKSAYVNLFIGGLLPVVTVVGETAIWLIHVTRALQGLPAVTIPDPPWPIWAAALWGVVFSLVGYAFYKGQIDKPGRILDVVLRLLPTAVVRRPAEAEDEDSQE